MSTVDPDQKREIDDIMKEVSSSSIPIVKPPEEIQPVKIDTNLLGQQYWSSKSNSLLSDYKYGENLARFGENELSTKAFFKRLIVSLCSIISNEYQKRGAGAEDLKPLYNILEASMLVLSKEIDKKGLKDYSVISIIAALDGFITNYNKQKEKK